ncbi:nitroreductase [Cochlodiniinecator piscidefendens]|uniref:nitroreductase n=1 Tax=Cochlodiniinecator piscidefendens TaxID=2715756 RepID=UPI001409787B|nr:nitroreductase [Cochlodiniinecator piscidefendens]
MTETDIKSLLMSRRSVRAYLPDPVSKERVAGLLEQARSAPSGANLQPGRYHVLTGGALHNLSEALAQAIAEKRPQVSEYSYFPDPMPAALKQRQRDAGYALYRVLGIERRDIAGRKAQFDLNYRFFDAPVAIVVSIDRAMGKGCYMDLGMSIMAFLTAATGQGLGTCGVGALANYADVAHDVLGLPEDELVVCGIALGWPDETAPVNQFCTTREPLDVFSSFHGFDDQA